MKHQLFTGLQPVWEEDSGTVATDTTPVKQSPPTPETPVNQTTEVKNPDALLKAYEATKEELRVLREFKKAQEAKEQQLETERLKREQQYEALIPLKVKEAVEPVNQSLDAERKKAEKLANDYAKLKTDYESLQKGYKTEKLKTAVNQAFISPDVNGDPDAVELFWATFGSKFDLSDDGKPVVTGSDSDLLGFMTGLKTDPGAKRLFKADLPEGAGTNPQSANNKAPTPTTKPRVITAEEAMYPKKYGVTLEDIQSGKVVVKG